MSRPFFFGPPPSVQDVWTENMIQLFHQPQITYEQLMPFCPSGSSVLHVQQVCVNGINGFYWLYDARDGSFISTYCDADDLKEDREIYLSRGIQTEVDTLPRHVTEFQKFIHEFIHDMQLDEQVCESPDPYASQDDDSADEEAEALMTAGKANSDIDETTMDE